MNCFESQRTRRFRGGFAYLWVLLLVAFMGIGLIAGVEILTTTTQRDKEAELLAIGRQFRVAIGRYYETQLNIGQAAGARPSAGHQYPPTLEDLLLDSRSPAVRRHLRKIFVDPMTGKPDWGLVLVAGRIAGIHSLSNSVPVKQDNFEADDMSFRDKKKYGEWIFTYPSDLLMRENTSIVDTTSTDAGKLPQSAPLQNSPFLGGQQSTPASP
ncbi:MAG: hypothetical protein JWN23_2573 [Rhodocyclales bacterium]|nr:hypothetical protein [Rhodocyclales bacterium]